MITVIPIPKRINLDGRLRAPAVQGAYTATTLHLPRCRAYSYQFVFQVPRSVLRRTLRNLGVWSDSRWIAEVSGLEICEYSANAIRTNNDRRSEGLPKWDQVRFNCTTIVPGDSLELWISFQYVHVGMSVLIWGNPKDSPFLF